jgi:hypothetical protein
MFGFGQGAESDCKMGQFNQSIRPAWGEACTIAQSAFNFLFFPLQFFLQHTPLNIVVRAVKCLHLNIFLSSAG